MAIGTYGENYRYRLEHTPSGILTVTDPVGYDNTEEEFARNKTHHGIVTNFSTNLKFIGNALEFISDIKNVYGLNETILLHKDVPDQNNSGQWINLYSSTLDLTTVSIENGELSIKINSGGFEEILKSRESEKLEIESTQAIDGQAMEPLVLDQVTLNGRRIFLKTKWERNEINNVAATAIQSNAGNTRNQTCGIPINIISQSHELAQNTIAQSQSSENVGTSGMMLFLLSDRTRTLTIDADLDLSMFVQQYENVEWAFFKICLTTYKDGTEFNLKNRIDFYDLANDHEWFGEAANFPANQFSKDTAFRYFNTVTLLEGESLALEVYLKADFYVDNNAGIRIFTTFNKADVVLEEDSVFPSTVTKTILLHDLGERLSNMIFGVSGRFKSEILGRTDLGYDQDGKYAYVGSYCGHWLRNFNLGDELYKNYSTSFKDFSDALRAVLNISIGIETRGFDEFIVAEPLTYFYNPNVVIVLPNQITNVKRTVLTEHIYSGVTIGYDKGGEYEEIMGLDEPNGRSNFITNFTGVNNTYDQLSPYRADVYGEEIQRRIQKENHPTEDASADKDIFLKDMILDSDAELGDYLRERVWQDDYIEAPQGIFSPDTAKNLRLSPATNLRRHFWILATALYKYPSKYFSFGSSTANSGMVTKPDASTIIGEKGSFTNNLLGDPLFEAEEIEFDHIVSNELLSQIKGSTTFNGQDVPNYYCKVQFTNEDGDTEYGYINSIKPGGPGKWKLIKATSVTVNQA